MNFSRFRSAALVFLLLFLVFSPAWARGESGGGMLQNAIQAYTILDYPTAIRLFRSLAARRDAKAEYYLGIMLLDGLGTSKDEKKGIAWIKKAATAGQPDACYKLYNAYMSKEYGLPLNPEVAEKWLNRAKKADQTLAAKGDPDAADALGGWAKNDAEKDKWYRLALLGYMREAKKGYIPAMEQLGFYYANGVGVSKDQNESKKWYLAAISKIIPIAKHAGAGVEVHLGLLYSGFGDVQDEITWYQKAIAGGSGDAAYRLGISYRFGSGGVKEDDKKAFELYKKSAELGDADGLRSLAYAYAYGIGAPKNPQEAIRLYQEYADKVDPSGLTAIGDMYKTGTGVAKDMEEAVKWYKRAAALNNLIAADDLGDLYRDGTGVPQDYQQALQWYKSCPIFDVCDLEAGKILLDGKAGTADPYSAFAEFKLGWYEDSMRDTSDAPGLIVQAVSALKKLSSGGDARAQKILSDNAKLIAAAQQAADKAHEKAVADAKANFDRDLKSLQSNLDFLKIWNGGYGNDWRRYLGIDWQSSVISDALALEKLNAYPDTPPDVDANLKTAEDNLKKVKSLKDELAAEDLLKQVIIAAPWRGEPYMDLALIENDFQQYGAAANLWKTAMEAVAPDPQTAAKVNKTIVDLKAKAEARDKSNRIVRDWAWNDFSGWKDGAIEHLQEAESLDPANVRVHLYLEWAYYEQKEYENAISEYNTLMRSRGFGVQYGGWSFPDDDLKVLDATGLSQREYIIAYLYYGLANDFTTPKSTKNKAEAFEAYQRVASCCTETDTDFDKPRQAIAEYNMGILLNNLDQSELEDFLHDLDWMLGTAVERLRTGELEEWYFGYSTGDTNASRDASQDILGFNIFNVHDRVQAAEEHMQKAIQFAPNTPLYQQGLQSVQTWLNSHPR